MGKYQKKLATILLTFVATALLLAACTFGSDSSGSLGGGNSQGTGAAVSLTPRAGGANRVAPQLGAEAPPIELVDYNGKPVSLKALAQQNKVVLVNYWATWCPPCRAEMPDIEAVYDRFGPQGFSVIAVNMQESASQVSAYAREGGYTFALALDPTGATSSSYRVMSLPTSYFVGSDGTVMGVNLGAMTQASLEDKLQQLGFSK